MTERGVGLRCPIASSLRFLLPTGIRLFCVLVLVPTVSSGQIQVRPADERPELPAFESPRGPSGTLLPPIVLPEAGGSVGSPRDERVSIRQIRIHGNTAVSEAEMFAALRADLGGEWAPSLDRSLTFGEIERVRDVLTLVYLRQDYLTSGAVIQSQRDGVLEIKIVEGYLVRIDVETKGSLRESFLEDRLWLGASVPVDVKKLERRLQALQQDSRIRSLEATLLPGAVRGESVLKVEVTQNRSGWLRVGGDNYQAPSIGSEGGAVSIGHGSLMGFGDSLRLAYTRTEGLDKFAASYSVPLHGNDTALELHARTSRGEVIDGPFESLEIESRTTTYGFTLSHPSYRSTNASLDVSLTGEWRRSKSFLLGTGFSFVPGPEDGESTVTVLRFGQDWSYRGENQVIAARSLFSWGLDLLGATNRGGSTPDGLFLSWLGQAQWARRFDFLDAQTIVRGDLQVASSPLLGIEQIGVGGRYSVRGYRENTLVRDNGFIGSIEIRVPIPVPTWSAVHVELGPFFDLGYSWNAGGDTVGPYTLVSLGIGTRWRVADRVDFEAYWGKDLKPISGFGDWSLQDDGVHLGLTVEFP